jgi:diguanylate cyclase (GGDEF)-like protein
MAKQVVELALYKPEAHAAATPAENRMGAFAGFTDRLLGLYGSAIPEPSRPTNTRFAERVETWRNKIRTEHDAGTLEKVFREVLHACEGHATRFHADLDQRESEVSELMNVLKDVIEALRGDSGRFEAELNRSTEVIRTMVDVEDIREVKRVLTHEVESLRKASAERQASESKRVERLTAQVETLRTSLREARARALTDPLTGAPNRAAFDAAIQEYYTQVASTGQTFVLAMADLDDLKKINDTHGHQVGDRVLVACVKVLQDAVGASGIVARYGGEEFVILLQKPTAEDGAVVLREALARIPPSYKYTIDGETKSIGFSFSGGVTEYAVGDSPDALVKRADDALYEAKRNGKKRVEIRHRGFIGNIVGWAGSGRRTGGDRRATNRPSPVDISALVGAKPDATASKDA